EVPVIVLQGLTRQQKRTLMLADNRIAANAGTDRAKLAVELQELLVENVDLTITGYAQAEIDQIILDHEESSADPADDTPEMSDVPVSKPGDLWLLGAHRILCDDACEPARLHTLMGTDRAAMVFTDPPYNVKVAGIVGRGKIKHDE